MMNTPENMSGNYPDLYGDAKTSGQREAWLKLVAEDPIDPDLQICDSHHHLFYYPSDHYLLDDFLRDIGGGHRIVQTVFVECGSMYRKSGTREMSPLGETEFAADISAFCEVGQCNGTRVAAAIVGFADLTLGAAAAPILEAQIAAGRGRFRGIRHVGVWNPDIDGTLPRGKSGSPRVKGLLLEENFREGFACLKRYGLRFDAWVYHTQLMELVDLAKTFPTTKIALNHTGGPLRAGPYAENPEKAFEKWEEGIAALATCPNVTVKIGALGRPRWGVGWHRRAKPIDSLEFAELVAPYVVTCVDRFGSSRCMFESNFPGDKTSCSYNVLWNAFKRVCERYSPQDRSLLFHDTAAKFYGLAD